MILSAMTDGSIVTQVPFSRPFTVGWEHLDSNGHMANTAYLDLAVNVRMLFFQANGFAMQEFEKQRFGPVVRRDEIEYFRELRLLDPVRVTLTLAGMSEDGSQFRLRNEFFRGDGKPAAAVTSTGGWLDLGGAAADRAARGDRPGVSDARQDRGFRDAEVEREMTVRL